MPREVDFNHDDEMLVTQITGRWIALLRKHGHEPEDTLSITMDVMAANGVNDNPSLDLGKLMEFDDANFAHDMGGISRHLDRKTGFIGDCFLARCAVSEPVGV